MYIESNLHKYKTTCSSTKLTIVCSISFTVPRMRKVTWDIKDLPIEFIKNDFIVSANEDDILYYYRFLAIYLNNELANTPKYDCAKQTKVAKKNTSQKT